MLTSMKDLKNYAIGATDGDIGHVKDLLFDDEAWVIRYFVVDTGNWLSNRQVLISPISMDKSSLEKNTLSVSLTKEQVKNSPDIDTQRPISRQHEKSYLGYYGYPNYWGSTGLWGMGMYPYALMPGYVDDGLEPLGFGDRDKACDSGRRMRHGNDDPHLRSCEAVIGYHIHAKDGEIGHVSDFILDQRTLAILHLVVDTSNWWGGHKVLISPERIEDVSWVDQSVSIDLTRQSLIDATPYQSTEQLNRERETRV